jgi:hypothetical protein
MEQSAGCTTAIHETTLTLGYAPRLMESTLEPSDWFQARRSNSKTYLGMGSGSRYSVPYCQRLYIYSTSESSLSKEASRNSYLRAP